MGRATSKGNEAKSKIKQPSDIPPPNTGGSDLWSNTLPLDHRGTPGHGNLHKLFVSEYISTMG